MVKITRKPLFCVALGFLCASSSAHVFGRTFTPTDEIIGNPGCGWEVSAGYYPQFRELCSIGAIYERVTWAQLEPEEGKYNWEPLEFAARTAADAGMIRGSIAARSRRVPPSRVQTPR